MNRSKKISSFGGNADTRSIDRYNNSDKKFEHGHDANLGWNKSAKTPGFALQNFRKHMGIVTFHVECDEVKLTTKELPYQEAVEMKWGESRLLDIKSINGTLRQIIFEGFDGKRYEFGTATDLKNRFVKVYNQGDKVQILATAPSDLVTLRLAKSVKSPHNY